MTDWLDRTLTVCAYYYCLCLNEADFHAKLRQMRLPGHRWSRFLTPGRHATTHYFEHDGKMIAIVCMNADMATEKTGAQIAALLVHEAVHIWQLHAHYIGAGNDHGDEEEAYAIQNIAQNLMESYMAQVK